MGCRGGNLKYRAMRLNEGNFAWGSENATRKTRILNVVYNATNNELVRTKTLVKGAIVEIDAHAFMAYYDQYYGVKLGKKREGEEKAQKKRAAVRTLEPEVDEQF